MTGAYADKSLSRDCGFAKVIDPIVFVFDNFNGFKEPIPASSWEFDSDHEIFRILGLSVPFYSPYIRDRIWAGYRPLFRGSVLCQYVDGVLRRQYIKIDAGFPFRFGPTLPNGQMPVGWRDFFEIRVPTEADMTRLPLPLVLGFDGCSFELVCSVPERSQTRDPFGFMPNRGSGFLAPGA
jgi:hypothetical protein